MCAHHVCVSYGLLMILRFGALQGVQINRDWDYARNVEITNGR